MNNRPPQELQEQIEELLERAEYKGSTLMVTKYHNGAKQYGWTPLRDELADLFHSHMQTANEDAVNKFCADLQHKVDMSFKLATTGHLVMPWEDTIRPIIYKRAAKWLGGDN